MSDRWTSRNQHLFGGPFDADEEEEGYRPWRTGQQGSMMNFKLVPHSQSKEPVRFIPYLQPITIELHEATHLLCLLCHSSGHVVFIHGLGLADLAEQISEKRVRSIHEIEPIEYHKAINDKAPMISRIDVKK